MDVGHAHIQNWDMDRMFRQLGNRIKGYHIKDNFGDGDTHLMAFEGSYDWETFFTNYKKYTPEATLVCEYISGTIDEIAASVERIRHYVNQLGE
jgi:sugar phosphate isomerase/epimerase